MAMKVLSKVLFCTVGLASLTSARPISKSDIPVDCKVQEDPAKGFGYINALFGSEVTLGDCEAAKVPGRPCHADLAKVHCHKCMARGDGKRLETSKFVIECLENPDYDEDFMDTKDSSAILPTEKHIEHNGAVDSAIVI